MLNVFSQDMGLSWHKLSLHFLPYLVHTLGIIIENLTLLQS